MAFKKKEWKARLVEFAGRRALRNVNTGESVTYDVTRNEGAISQEGDAFSPENMNGLEQRIFEAFADVEVSSDTIKRDVSKLNANGNIEGYSVEPAGLYVTYTGTDGVKLKKKLGEPIYLGVGTSFDVSSYAGYEKLTVDNFFIQPSGTISTSNWDYGDYTGHNIGQVGIKSLTASINFTYDASAGVLTAYIAASAYGGVNNDPREMKTASGTAPVKAYLIY